MFVNIQHPDKPLADGTWLISNRRLSSGTPVVQDIRPRGHADRRARACFAPDVLHNTCSSNGCPAQQEGAGGRQAPGLE